MAKSTTERKCKECQCDISNLHGKSVRCKECQSYYTKRLRKLRDEKKRIPRCITCGELIMNKHSNATKYCDECADAACHQSMRVYARKQRAKGKELGTGLLGPHRLNNFGQELKAIRKEMKRLGLNGNN